MERLIALRDEQPDEFAAFSAVEKMALGFYEIGKTAARIAGLDTTGGRR